MTDEVVKPQTAPPPALLTLSLIRQHYIPQCDRTFRRWISAGTFPVADVKIGGMVQMWARETIEGWIKEQRDFLSRSS